MISLISGEMFMCKFMFVYVLCEMEEKKARNEIDFEMLNSIQIEHNRTIRRKVKMFLQSSSHPTISPPK